MRPIQTACRIAIEESRTSHSFSRKTINHGRDRRRLFLSRDRELKRVLCIPRISRVAHSEFMTPEGRGGGAPALNIYDLDRAKQRVSKREDYAALGLTKSALSSHCRIRGQQVSVRRVLFHFYFALFQVSSDLLGFFSSPEEFNDSPQGKSQQFKG